MFLLLGSAEVSRVYATLDQEIHTHKCRVQISDDYVGITVLFDA